MTTTIHPPLERSVAPNGVLLLSERPTRMGPVSRRLVLRLVAILGVLVVIGTVMVLLSDSAAARAAGLSLVFPGGGLLYIASPLLFVAAMVALVLAVVLWWGYSAHWAIPLVWLCAGIVSVLLADGPRFLVDRGTTWPWAIPVVYALAVSAAGLAVFRSERTYRRKLARVPELNAYLASAEVPVRHRAPEEPTDFDAELLRWTYDMALQPLDEFNGFDWGEQIHGPTCVRYQLNMLGYALAVYAANYLPNAPQPVESALANLIEKATDLRVWGYWRNLNLWGNFDANPDPIIRDNIMLSAYIGEQINLYEAATGSDRFDQPGALTFVWKDGRTFAYDHHTVAEAVRRNFEANPLGFFPCEPGWVFTACNTQGAQALKGHDTLHGTNHWAMVEPRWRHAVEVEMMTPDGNLPHIRSKLVGLSFNTGEVPGGEYFATGTNGFADVAPDLAARASLLSMRGVDAKMAALRDKIVDGELQVDMNSAPERNTLITTAVPAWTGVYAGARAVGEDDVARAALRRMQTQCGTGRRWPERPLHAGVQTIGIHLLMRWAIPLNSAALAVRGYRPPTGPILRDYPYDQVLVTKARSLDGEALQLGMRSLNGPTAVTLGFEALIPGCDYRLLLPSGAVAIRTDGHGRGIAELVIDQPIDAILEPVNPPVERFATGDVGVEEVSATPAPDQPVKEGSAP